MLQTSQQSDLETVAQGELKLVAGLKLLRANCVARIETKNRLRRRPRGLTNVLKNPRIWELGNSIAPVGVGGAPRRVETDPRATATVPHAVRFPAPKAESARAWLLKSSRSTCGSAYAPKTTVVGYVV